MQANDGWAQIATIAEFGKVKHMLLVSWIATHVTADGALVCN